MAVTASRFFGVTKEPPLEGSGWQIRVLGYWDFTTLVTVLSDYTTFSVGPELSASGAGSITLDLGSPFFSTKLLGGANATALLDHEYVFEAWEDGARRFAFLGRNVEEQLVEETGARQVTISGPGIAEVLAFGIINRPGWPAHPGKVGVSKKDGTTPIYRSNSSSDLIPAYLWRFPMKWPTMRMWWTTFKAAQRRGLLSWVTPTFTATKDSAGQPFTYVPTLQTVADNEGFQPETPDQNLLAWLNQCTGQEDNTWFGQRLEWFMYPGFKLAVQTRIGVDRSRGVRFFEGGIESKDRVRSRENIVNIITAVDVDGSETVVSDGASIARYNRREARNDTNKNITDPTLRAQLADRYLKQGKDESSEWTIAVPYDQPGRRPWRDFNVGDTVSVVRYHPGQVATPESYRILAMTVTVSAESEVPSVELTLQSRMDSRLKEIERQITRIINEPKNFKIGDLRDVNVPNLPDTEGVLTYDPNTGRFGLTAGTGGNGGGPNVFIQATDPTTVPGTTVNPGDFWLETYG